MLPIRLNLSQTLQPKKTGQTRKLFHWKDDGTLEFRIDWSSIESFLACNRLAEYKLVHSKTSQPKSALVFGAAMHAALEVWYRNFEKIGTTELQQTPYEGHQVAVELTQPLLLERCFTAIDTAYAEYPIGAINDWRTSDYCKESFLRYLGTKDIIPLQPLSHDGQKLVEFSFAMPLGKTEIPTSVFEKWGFGILTNDAEREKAYAADGELRYTLDLPVSIEWTGIIDMLTTVHGQNWVVDHKTTSVLSTDFFDGFEIAMQPVGYFAAARAALPHLNLRGFMVNVLACRKPSKTGVGFEPHQRLFPYSDWHVEEFTKDALHLIEEFLANLTTGYFPRKTQWCLGKFGKCAFFDVCALPPGDQRIMMLQSSQYTDNTWKPV